LAVAVPEFNRRGKCRGSCNRLAACQPAVALAKAGRRGIPSPDCVKSFFIFLRTSPRDFRRKNKRKTDSISGRAAVDFGAGLGARVHGRYPRGSRPWEERRGQHPNRCNSRSLPCYRIYSVLIENAVFITRSICCPGGAGKVQLPGSRPPQKFNGRPSAADAKTQRDGSDCWPSVAWQDCNHGPMSPCSLTEQ
jgi:hypothetical protein